MPTIPVNLSNVQGYEELPVGEYLAQIDSIVHKPSDDPDRFAQLMVKYTVIDEGALGKTATEWLSLSPKAAFRLKKWFAKFGLDDTAELNVDDDTEELLDPDLVGYQVVIKSFDERDKRKAADDPDAFRRRIGLVSVEDEVGSPAASPSRAEKAEPETAEEDEGEAEPVAAAPSRREAARPARPQRRRLR
jgi:hypothetical protein